MPTVIYSELFYLIDSGPGRWTIRHQITQLPAGTLLRTRHGFTLSDESKAFVGSFATIDDALHALYDLV